MNLDSILTWTARVERDVQQGENDFGQPITAPETVYPELECFVWPGPAKMLLDGEKVVSIGEYSMVVRSDVQLRELDRVRDVHDHEGELVPDMKNLRVLAVVPYPGLAPPPEVRFLEVGLERID